MKTLKKLGMTISLNAVMAYKNPALVARLQEKHHLSKEDAEMLFDDTKRFLYLLATSGKRLSPTKMIDEGWHNFILFTKDYATFCKRYLGRFIHHTPVDKVHSRVKSHAVMANADCHVVKATFGHRLSKFWNAGAKMCYGNCGGNCE
jgi:hypothetical protein